MLKKNDAEGYIMKCKYCGGEIDNNSKNCPFCGSSISFEEKKELEQLNKQGCPRCSSTNISFRREQVGVAKNKKGSRTLYQTKGICNDCGCTWTTDAPKKSKTWLWVLGWIFIFPLPLTILLLRKKGMKPALKYGIIAGAWVIFLLFVIINNISNSNNNAGANNAVAYGNIKSIDPLSTKIELDLSSKYIDRENSYFHVTVKDKEQFSYDDIVLVSENVDIATIEYDKTALDTFIYFNVSGVSAGETYVYAKSKDGSVVSEKISVKVSGVRPTPTPTNTPVPTPTPEPTPDPNATNTPSPKPTERMVWISDTGSKYHNTSTCSNMDNPRQVTESWAESHDYKPCGRCGG